MTTKKETERIKMATYLANMCGCCDPVSKDFWDKFTKNDIKEIQYDMYLRAYDVVCKIEQGDQDCLGMIQHIFSHPSFNKGPTTKKNQAIECMAKMLPQLRTFIYRTVTYAESPIIVPSGMNILSRMDQNKAQGYIDKVLAKKGISKEEYQQYFLAMEAQRAGNLQSKINEDPKRLRAIEEEQKKLVEQYSKASRKGAR
jgi:hypothetical protein